MRSRLRAACRERAATAQRADRRADLTAALEQRKQLEDDRAAAAAEREAQAGRRGVRERASDEEAEGLPADQAALRLRDGSPSNRWDAPSTRLGRAHRASRPGARRASPRRTGTELAASSRPPVPSPTKSPPTSKRSALRSRPSRARAQPGRCTGWPAGAAEPQAGLGGRSRRGRGDGRARAGRGADASDVHRRGDGTTQPGQGPGPRKHRPCARGQGSATVAPRSPTVGISTSWWTRPTSR